MPPRSDTPPMMTAVIAESSNERPRLSCVERMREVMISGSSRRSVADRRFFLVSGWKSGSATQ